MAASKAGKQVQQVLKIAEGHDLPEPDETEKPDSAELSEADLLARVRQLQSRYKRALDELERAGKRLQQEADSVQEQREKQEGAVAAIRQREESLLTREREMSLRELDAQTGFAAREQQYWDDLRARMDELRGKLRESVLEVEEADIVGVRERIVGFQRLRDDLEGSFAERTASLLVREADLELREREHSRTCRQHAAREQQLLWDVEAFEVEKVAALARERSEHDHERRTWLEQKAVLEAAAEELRRRVARADELERQAQFIDPLRVEREREELIDRLKSAHEELSRRPDKVEVEDLISQLRVAELRSNELDAARERASRMEEQLESTRASLESRRLVEVKNDNLTAEKAALEIELQELRRALGELSDRRSEVRPFQQCAAIDEDPTLQASVELWAPEDNLEQLVAYLRNSIAAEGLYYEESTLRSFLAGMGTSHLHLLQGISGTGKSSLPQAVAEALGVECRTIEVQAAWRDRQDLLGYFNPFEHRYEETDFLMSLYLAGSPRHSGSPFFVLLDEMNLSHPEQYLADVLSAMERPQRDRYLRLMNHASPLAPRQLHRGMELALPPNVWIVGTANHDETTVSFAPKTYDRSHVMELPTRHPSPIEGVRRSPQPPISLAGLEQMFRNAEAQDRRGAISCSSDFLEGLRPTLAAMGVGWGNRIEKQLRRYAPIVTGAGGSVREAVDDFVALKILKKLEGRFDFTAAQLERLRSEIDVLWADVPGAPRSPERMVGLLDMEIERLR
jgi:hypothetical protein